MYKFMYTRSEILLESAFYGDLVKIDVATDMMYETYIDEMLMQIQKKNSTRLVRELSAPLFK